MNVGKVRTILDRIRYKHWHFHVGDGWLQVRFSNEDAEIPGGRYVQYGRKWRLSEHMTTSEIVQTALMAVLAAEEHEAREAFKYRGHAIFGPHLDIEALVGLKTSKRKKRKQ